MRCLNKSLRPQAFGDLTGVRSTAMRSARGSRHPRRVSARMTRMSGSNETVPRQREADKHGVLQSH
jgi:hypothetical protein